MKCVPVEEEDNNRKQNSLWIKQRLSGKLVLKKKKIYFS